MWFRLPDFWARQFHCLCCIQSRCDQYDKCLARTFGPEIRVNGVAPGAIDTRWLRKGLGEKEFEALNELLRHTTPLQVMATPEDVADAIVWLAEGANMMTGETIKLDGGQHLGGRGGLRRKE